MMEEFRAIVAGCRDFTDYDFVRAHLDALFRNKRETHRIVIIEGGYRGVDQLAKRYGIENGYEVVEVPAQWDRFGPAAGPIRNREMAEDHGAEVCVVFTSNGRGSNDMLDKAEKAGLVRRVIEIGGNDGAV
jgi:hypothetical protein